MSPAEKKKRAAQQATRKPKKQLQRKDTRRPVIVKTTETAVTGVHSFETSRYAVGYVQSGSAFIYSGDLRQEVARGDVFFLAKGTHYIENLPDVKKPFEQIMFFYTPEQAGRAIADLSVNHGVDTSVRHSCELCQGTNHIIDSGWRALKIFFDTVDNYLGEGWFARDAVAETLMLTELIYHIVSHTEGCLRTRLLGSTDPEKELLEVQINEYVFSDITLEELAARNNRSLTSFKRKFKDYFNETPHRWVVRQRLMHARLALTSTNKSIAHIGSECHFPNTSHFIKLFRMEFGMTPARYRQKYRSDMAEEAALLETGNAQEE